MKRKEKGCEIVKENIKSVKITSVGRGILGTIHICFNKDPERKERERTSKCLRNNKLKVIWGDKALLVK